jgi:hypothetical protein
MSHAEVEELKEQLAAALSAQQTAERELERMRPIEAAAREFRLAWFDTMGCSEEREAVFRALDAASEGEKLCRHCGNPKNYPDHGDTIGRGHDFEPAPPKTEGGEGADQSLPAMAGDRVAPGAESNAGVAGGDLPTDERIQEILEMLRGPRQEGPGETETRELLDGLILAKQELTDLRSQLAAAEAKNAELENHVRRLHGWLVNGVYFEECGAPMSELDALLRETQDV